MLDNLHNGFNVYWMANLAQPVGSCIAGPYSTTYSRQVDFGELDNIIVGGSDHGVAYVFDKQTQNRLALLDHGVPYMVQAIAVKWILSARCYVQGGRHTAYSLGHSRGTKGVRGASL
jgi:hypothetical protein